MSDAIRATIARRPVAMAVAYWGNEAMQRLELPHDLTGYRIACDAFSGACSPTTMEELLRRQADVRDVPGLHAKVYHSSSALVVASANASTNGLSEDTADAGLEAGMWVRMP